MGAGIILMVVGAILAFAVRVDGDVVDIQTVGLIFMLAGAAIIAYARRERRLKEVATHEEQRLDPSGNPQGAVRERVVHEVVSDDEADTR